MIYFILYSKLKTMETDIKKTVKKKPVVKVKKSLKRYSPEGMDHKNDHRIKCVEATEEYTRIDFIYKASMKWDNGGWIQMDKSAYIQATGSSEKYYLVKALKIPLAPSKLYFKRKGQYHTYTLIFPALPSSTTSIDIIEKEAPGTYFNFYKVNFSAWMTVSHVADIPRGKN